MRGWPSRSVVNIGYWTWDPFPPGVCPAPNANSSIVVYLYKRGWHRYLQISNLFSSHLSEWLRRFQPSQKSFYTQPLDNYCCQYSCFNCISGKNQLGNYFNNNHNPTAQFLLPDFHMTEIPAPFSFSFSKTKQITKASFLLCGCFKTSERWSVPFLYLNAWPC